MKQIHANTLRTLPLLQMNNRKLHVIEKLTARNSYVKFTLRKLHILIFQDWKSIQINSEYIFYFDLYKLVLRTLFYIITQLHNSYIIKNIWRA